MKHTVTRLLVVIFAIFFLEFAPLSNLFSQQIDLPRISTMPWMPQPYEMKNWKSTSHGYDSLVFNQNLTGQYLPLLFFRENTVNYPAYESFGLHTAVGTTAPTSGEAINVIPAVVGATLSGIDKSDQFGKNWVKMVQEFYNRRPEENIYLNHPVTNSGFDWWYETMPNIFYMQLMALYPDEAVFQEQLPVVASQWLRAVRAMGGSDTPWAIPYMNYRAWNMSTMQPLGQGVRQPEAAGAIAWILYNAYVKTSDPEFLKGADWALEFLDQWNNNPSYELQLPYGIYTAARMNAEKGTDYNIEKMLNWAFDRGALRGWGAISGNWGGYDVHGLIGEANDNGNDYAFMMNGFQQAAALVPMLRYDARFARAIGRWVLNMANASRLFYPGWLPADMQDNFDWSQQYDPNSYIAYEALREIKHGKSPFATGDAIDGGWALTNLMLYGSSHVGYLASIVETTNVEGILQLDLLATDFFRQEAYPTWLYYNPHTNTHLVHHTLPAGSWKIYDVITRQVILQNQSGVAQISIPGRGVRMPVIIPQDVPVTVNGQRTLAGDIIIDFNNGQPAGMRPPRIKALAAKDTLIVTGAGTAVFCTAVDPNDQTLTYQWFINENEFSAADSIWFSAPDEPGLHFVACRVTNTDGLSDSLGIYIRVTERIPYPPTILEITATPRKARPAETVTLFCLATDHYIDPLIYQWSASDGTLAGQGASVSFTVPSTPGDYWVSVMVFNPDALFDSDSIRLMVRDFPEMGQGQKVAAYPLHGNANDTGPSQLHGQTGGGVSWVTDMNGVAARAASFNGTTANILLPDDDKFQFNQALSLSFFMKIHEHTPHEQHPLSHGSWEHRFKVSLGSQRLRFTLNTQGGIRDLDSESLLVAGQWYHVVAVYDGNDMEIWLDGKLDAFTNHSGLINSSPHRLVMGQNIPGNNNFNFNGVMSLVNIYDFPLSPAQILEDLILTNPTEYPHTASPVTIFPNPLASGSIMVTLNSEYRGALAWEIYSIDGRRVKFSSHQEVVTGQFVIPFNNGLPPGIYFLRVHFDNRVHSARIVYTGR